MMLADRQSAAEDRVLAANTAGLAAMEMGDLPAARRHFDYTVTLAREHGLLLHATGAQFNIGLIYLVQGQLADADALLRTGFDYRQSVQHRRLMGARLIGLGYIAVMRAQPREATELLRDGLRQLVSLKETTFLLHGLLACSSLALLKGQPHEAVTLFGAATHQADQVGLKFGSGLLALVQTQLEHAWEALDGDELAQALQRGETLSFDAAVAFAQSLLRAL